MLLRLLIPLVFAAASLSDPPAFAPLTLRGIVWGKNGSIADGEVSKIDQFPLRASERGAEVGAPLPRDPARR